MPLVVALLLAWALPIAATLILVLVGCKKKKKEAGKSDKNDKASSVPSNNSKKDKNSKAGAESSAAGKDNDNPKSVLAPRSFKPENKEELEAMQNIKGGKVRAAKDNETVDDAQSDWGNVKSMMDKENAKDEKGGK